MIPSPTTYNNFEDLLMIFYTGLPDPSRIPIASVSKYAWVNNRGVVLKAVKHPNPNGFNWILEVTIE